jgi:hypothetical protein
MKTPSPRGRLALPAPLLLTTLALLTPGADAQQVRDGVITYPDGFTMEVGTLGELPPAAPGGDTLLVHADTEGGAAQVLQALAGGAGGFSAVWIDQRDGNLGLFLGHLEPSEPGAATYTPFDGAPVHLPRSSRQGSPQLALWPSGPGDDAQRAGTVAWIAEEQNGSHAMLRLFGAGPEPGTEAGERASGASLQGNPVHLAALGGPDDLGLTRSPAGRGLVTWFEGEQLVGRLLARSPETGQLGPGQAVRLVSGLDPVGGQLRLALDDDGGLLLAWSELVSTEPEAAPTLQVRALFLDLRSPEPVVLGEDATTDGPVLSLGPGRPLELATGSDGTWLLVSRPGGTSLELLGPDGARLIEPAVVGGPDLVSADLCAWDSGRGAAVVVESRVEWDGRSVPRAAAGRIDLHLFGPEGRRLTPAAGIDPLDADAVEARGPRVAASGRELAVAWTDRRADAGDVYVRVLDMADRDRPAQRWNQDRASSDQTHAAVASDGRRRAVVAWEDGRSGTPRIWTRQLEHRAPEAGAPGELLLGPEAPADEPGSHRTAFPAVALAEDGGYLVTWKESLDAGERGWVLRARAFGPDGRALGPPEDLDRGYPAAHAWPATVAALPRRAGYLVTWVRPDEGPVARRLELSGRPATPPRLLVPRALGADADPRNPDLERLDDGRFLVAWDQLVSPVGPTAPAGAQDPKEAKAPKDPRLQEPAAPAAPKAAPLRVNFALLTDTTGVSQGVPFLLGRSPMGGDHDPAVAATPGGGFLVAWTGNDGPTRDVFAQVHDGRGRPASPLLAISVKANEQDYPDAVRLDDERVLVAWEDDISGRDHGFARALDPAAPSSRRTIFDRAPARGELFPRQLLDDVETVFVEDRHAPRLAPLAGGYLAVWDDLARGQGHDVRVRWFELP